MVPMMVPSESVHQIAAGYPASHLQYASPPGPWMTTGHAAVGSHMGVHNSVGYQHPATMHGQVAPAPSFQAAAAPGAATMVVGGPPAPSAPGTTTMLPPPQSYSAPPQMHPFTGHAQAGTMGAPQQQQTPPPNAASLPTTATATVGQQQQQQLPPQGNQGQQAPGAAQYQMQPVLMHANSAPPSMAMYPQMSGGVPTVAFGLHPHAATTGLHPHATATAAPAAATHGAAPLHSQGTMQATYPPGEAMDTSPSNAMATGGTAAQQQPPVAAAHQQPSSEKPSAHAQGGGGNLAHCA